MTLDHLRATRAAVVGLTTTISTPPLIVEVAVYYMDGGVVTGGPFRFEAAADAPLAQVPIACWENQSRSPEWHAVAPRLIDIIGDRSLIVHDQARHDVLRRHLPDWQATKVVLTERVSQQIWPGLTSYALSAMGAHRGLFRRDSALRATTEAQLLTMLITTMLATAVSGHGATCNGSLEQRVRRP